MSKPNPSPQTSPQSSPKSVSTKFYPSSEHNPFHCSAEWHLRELSSRLASVLYSWGRKLSFKSDCFFPSVESIARYFCCDRATVFRALQELVESGFAEIVQREPGKAVVYRCIQIFASRKM
jgi:hypothetical protein